MRPQHSKVDIVGLQYFEVAPAVILKDPSRWNFHEGYVRDDYENRENGIRVPTIKGLVSKPQIIPVFLALLQEMSESHHDLKVVLDTKHFCKDNYHDNVPIENVSEDLLLQVPGEYLDVLLNDGHAGMSVLGVSNDYFTSENDLSEVRLTFDKEFLVYSTRQLDQFIKVLERYGISKYSEMVFPGSTPNRSLRRGDFVRFNELAFALQGERGEDFWELISDDDEDIPVEPGI